MTSRKPTKPRPLVTRGRSGRNTDTPNSSGVSSTSTPSTSTGKSSRHAPDYYVLKTRFVQSANHSWSQPRRSNVLLFRWLLWLFKRSQRNHHPKRPVLNCQWLTHPMREYVLLPTHTRLWLCWICEGNKQACICCRTPNLMVELITNEQLNI